MTAIAPVGARVLMIDDDEDTFVLTRAMLGQVHGSAYQLDWHPTPEEGLSALLSGDYDACLLDVHLGPRDGLEVLDRALEHGCPTPIIVLTGSFGRIRSDASIVRAGASDFLSKHRLTPESLDKSVRYAIERHRLVGALQEERRNLSEREERLKGLIGQLTGDVAHELNNVLTVVLANSLLLRDVVPASSLTDLDAIVDAAARGGLMIEKLREAGHHSGRTSNSSGSTPAAEPVERPRGMETILLVEDEDDIRRTARRVLERAGYTVLDARNGHDALALLDATDLAVDLILSDIVMPNMGGRELASQLRATGNMTRIAFMTGYDPTADDLPADVFVLRKPWTLDELLQHVRAALGPPAT